MACDDNNVYVGDKPVITLEVRDPSTDALTDPSALVMTVRKPDATEEVLTAYGSPGTPITRTALGMFRVTTYPCATAGPYVFLWRATMASGALATGRVERQVVTP